MAALRCLEATQTALEFDSRFVTAGMLYLSLTWSPR